jgi:hypothetical protein
MRLQESCQERARGWARAQTWFSSESRDDSCPHKGRRVGKLDLAFNWAVSAESKEALRSTRPLNYSSACDIKAMISTAPWLSLLIYGTLHILMLLS